MNPWSTLNLSRNKTNSKERKKEKIHEERNQKKRRRKRRKILTNSWNTISEIWFPDGKTPENQEKEVCKSIIFNLSGICLSNVFLPFPEIAVSVVCISGIGHANGTKGSKSRKNKRREKDDKYNIWTSRRVELSLSLLSKVVQWGFLMILLMIWTRQLGLIFITAQITKK